MSTAEPHLVPVGDIELCAQEFGEVGQPPVLLLSGAAASMDWWDDDLCAAIAGGGRLVVRYDHRDTGRSTTEAPGSPSYDAGQLDRDAHGLVEALGLGPVHLVGVSMGGGIAQSMAVRRPDLVASLTLMATSPAGGVDRSTLPAVAPALAKRFANPPADPDWSDREQVVQWFVEGERAFAGSTPLDEDRVRTIATTIFERSIDVAAGGNHWLAEQGDDEGDIDIRRIAVPTLIVHGTDDPLFPLGHGEALVAAIPGARLLVVEGMGHQVPPHSAWAEVVPALLAHTAGRTAEGEPC